MLFRRALAGGRVSVNKNFFHEKSSDALIAKMRAARAEKLRLMRGAQVLSLSDYPMSRALGDVGDYYYAGTIVGALQGIIADAGEREKTATAEVEEKLKEKIELQYRTDPIRARINRWLDADPKTNVPRLSEWLAAKGVKVVAPFWVNDEKTSASDLLDAIRDLDIP